MNSSDFADAIRISNVSETTYSTQQVVIFDKKLGPAEKKR